MTAVTAGRGARPADHDPGSRPRRLSAPGRTGKRRARSGQPAGRQSAGRQSRPAPARWRSPISDRRLRSRPTMCGSRSPARRRAIDILPGCRRVEGRRVAPMQSLRASPRRSLAHRRADRRHRALPRGRGRLRHRPGARQRRSTDIRGGIGGWHGRALAAGDRLPLQLARAGERGEVWLDGLRSSGRGLASAPSSGPQHDHFPEARSRPSSPANTTSARAPTAWGCA